jgi:hypothetical protein
LGFTLRHKKPFMSENSNDSSKNNVPSENQPPDRLNELGVLNRREIEARILGPVLEALGAEFGRQRVLEVTRRVVIDIARQQGKALADSAGRSDLPQFAASLENWKKGGALEMETLEQNEARFSFDVRRCRYAEMYRALGIPELGALLSCNRDASLIEGFNPEIKLTRTQTIMEGAPFCDFRYELK